MLTWGKEEMPLWRYWYDKILIFGDVDNVDKMRCWCYGMLTWGDVDMRRYRHEEMLTWGDFDIRRCLS